ncbi:hypothetical protein D8M04_05650 [Oceanobacillus piezotolerans]|uniref:Uncharacterized protein n=1 Tax=Oceanobacillus piezotolerans TaxID=2448030 RepID=A0A498DDF3_9BACI|nr:hypothetical protein [Oceanobacillus piezotolerans]RLL46690.1 hypothetical protein D8M04_05650 [Oceanobacillus piezotolerans]
MTQQLIDDLLELITLWLEDLEEIRANGYQTDKLIAQLEKRAGDVESGILGLEENIKQIDADIQKVLSCKSKAKDEKYLKIS